MENSGASAYRATGNLRSFMAHSAGTWSTYQATNKCNEKTLAAQGHPPPVPSTFRPALIGWSAARLLAHDLCTVGRSKGKLPGLHFCVH